MAEKKRRARPDVRKLPFVPKDDGVVIDENALVEGEASDAQLRGAATRSKKRKGRHVRVLIEDERVKERRVLDWWRTTYGALPTSDVVSPLRVSVERTGVVGAMRVIDFREQEHRNALTTCFGLGEIATKHFELVTRMLNGIEVALHKNDARVWRRLEDAYAQMATIKPEYVAQEHLGTLAEFRDRVLQLKPSRSRSELPMRRDPLTAFRRLDEHSPQKLALRGLQLLEARLNTATDDEVFNALEGVSSERKAGRNNKSVAVALARLMVRRRFWGAIKKAIETEDDAVRRYAKTLSDNWTRAPERTRRA